MTIPQILAELNRIEFKLRTKGSCHDEHMDLLVLINLIMDDERVKVERKRDIANVVHKLERNGWELQKHNRP